MVDNEFARLRFSTWILNFLKCSLPLFPKLQVPPEVVKANGNHLLVNDRSKYKSMLIRAYSSVWMIGGFAFIIYMGHLYIWAMVVVIQIFMAKELFNLLRRAHEDRQLPGFRLLNWWVRSVWCHLACLLFSSYMCHVKCACSTSFRRSDSGLGSCLTQLLIKNVIFLRYLLKL